MLYSVTRMAAYCCYTCLLRKPFPWIAILGCLLAFSQYQGFGFLTIFLTASVLILCPVLVCQSKPCKQKQLQTEEPNSSLQEEETETEKEDATDKMEGEEVSKQKNQEQKEEKTTTSECLVRSSAEVLLSDSESLDHTTSTEDYSENDSMFRENLSHSTNHSDGSISDEESLIEIVLPTGHYMDSKRSSAQEPSWYGFQQKWPDCSLQSHFRQQNWMEMLNEMNEENFIEIDLCMGSIKCSRFEIQA